MADATDTKATGGSSKRTAAIATIITLVVLALVGGGLAYGLHVRQEQEAQQAREKAVAAAQTECDRSIDRLAQTRGRLAKQVTDGRTQNALKLTDSQVADPKTLRTLKRESADKYAAASCRTSSIRTLKKRIKANQMAAKAAADQTTRLTSAVTDVERSKATKDEADRKATEARRKTEEQRKADEARRQKEASAAAQARQTAPRRTYTSHHLCQTSRRPHTTPHNNPAPSPRRQAPATPKGSTSNNGGSKSSSDDMGWETVPGGDHVEHF